MHPNRKCLREPISEIFEAAAMLRQAVDLHHSSQNLKAAELFRAANLSAIRDWTESIWGKHDRSILQVRHIPDAQPLLSKESRIPARMPTSAEMQHLLARDGYHCRFCQIPVIPKYVRQRMVSAYPDAVKWGRTNLSQHAALQAMWLQFDHLLPHARGGNNSPENILITCAPCNYGRMNYTIEELGINDPRLNDIHTSNWNGLIDFK